MKKLIQIFSETLFYAISGAMFTAVMSGILAVLWKYEYPILWEAFGYAEYELGMDLVIAWLTSAPANFIIGGVAALVGLQTLISNLVDTFRRSVFTSDTMVIHDVMGDPTAHNKDR